MKYTPALLPITSLRHDAQSFGAGFYFPVDRANSPRGKRKAETGGLRLPTGQMSMPHPTIPEYWVHTPSGPFKEVVQKIGRLNDKRNWPSPGQRVAATCDLLDAMDRAFAAPASTDSEPEAVFADLRRRIGLLLGDTSTPTDGTGSIKLDKSMAEATLDHLEVIIERFPVESPDWTSAFINGFASAMAEVVKLLLGQAKAEANSHTGGPRESLSADGPAKEMA